MQGSVVLTDKHVPEKPPKAPSSALSMIRKFLQLLFLFFKTTSIPFNEIFRIAFHKAPSKCLDFSEIFFIYNFRLLSVFPLQNVICISRISIFCFIINFQVLHNYPLIFTYVFTSTYYVIYWYKYICTFI